MANSGTPFMNTPLVIAMPQPMAEALGWPDKALGWSDILALATDQTGWAKYGHPEWGPFRLGKTNPNFSTSGLHALIAQNYAATGKTRDLTLEDLAKPEVNAFDTSVESAVTHYGDTTLTYLNNWYRADQQGTALQYTSAIAVEEKSVIDYNSGNPDGKLDPGEEPRPPRTKLVAIYPKEGTVFSDNPLFVLDAPWVTDDLQPGRQALLRLRPAARQPGEGAAVQLPPRQPVGGHRRPDHRRQRRRPQPAPDPAADPQARRARRPAQPVELAAQERPGAAGDRRLRAR